MQVSAVTSHSKVGWKQGSGQCLGELAEPKTKSNQRIYTLTPASSSNTWVPRQLPSCQGQVPSPVSPFFSLQDSGGVDGLSDQIFSSSGAHVQECVCTLHTADISHPHVGFCVTAPIGPLASSLLIPAPFSSDEGAGRPTPSVVSSLIPLEGPLPLPHLPLPWLGQRGLTPSSTVSWSQENAWNGRGLA